MTSTNAQTILTDSGISVSDWIDAATWEVFSSLRELELLGIKNIRLASQDLHGVILSSETVAEDIWCRILDTVTRKGEHSRRIHSADDKSYLRPDLLEWFKQRVEDDQSRSGRKIYVKRDLPHILTPFRAPMASVCAKRKGQVLHQQYSLKKYRYKHIADNVCQWLDEVFLRPKEMSDIHKLTFIEKRERLKNSVFKSLHDVSEFWVECCCTQRSGSTTKASLFLACYTWKSRGRKILETCISFAAIRR